MLPINAQKERKLLSRILADRQEAWDILREALQDEPGWRRRARRALTKYDDNPTSIDDVPGKHDGSHPL